MPRLLKSAEACQALGVSYPTLKKMVDSGQLRVVKIGRGFRIPEAELQKLVSGAASQPAPSAA